MCAARLGGLARQEQLAGRDCTRRCAWGKIMDGLPTQAGLEAQLSVTWHMPQGAVQGCAMH